MQSSSVIKSSTTQADCLSQEDRTRIYQLLNDLDNDQLRFVLTLNIRNATLLNEIKTYNRTQLFHECFSLMNNYYSTELEQTLRNLRLERYSPNYLQQSSQLDFRAPFRQEGSAFHTHTPQIFNGQQSFRPVSSSIPTPQLRTNHPALNAAQPITNHDHHRPPLPPPPPPQQQQNPLMNSIFGHSQQNNSSTHTTALIPKNSSTTFLNHYLNPVLPIPLTTTSTPSHHTPILPTPSNAQNITVNKINFKNLPFYRMITCVHERSHIFHYDTYRKQYTAHDDFILPVDACNQLSLSYDYDPELNIYQTSKCLLLRLARIDQPPTLNGKYEDNLPPNIIIIVNGRNLSNLPTPKACTRQQSDLLRVGREIDITSNVMFNPMVKNEIKLTWLYRQDNTSLHIQYSNAMYVLQIHLAERLTVEALCEKVIKKTARFHLQDSVKLLAKARARDYDLGLEVSDQKLKLVCPIDQRRLKVPIRATTCQHLQCFDLKNYIALNEKSNKWICPVCNKAALFNDLQIDLHTESIINSIKNEEITEITINSDLEWKPIIPSDIDKERTDSKSIMKPMLSSNEIILIDDE